MELLVGALLGSLAGGEQCDGFIGGQPSCDGMRIWLEEHMEKS